MPQLSKTELAGIVEQFTTNIEDRLINPHIQKTIEIGFAEIVPQSLLNAIVSLNLSGAGNPELKAFYNSYFKQIWSYLAYIRFFTWHGRNITQFGLVSINDDTTSQISDKARGELINNIEHDSQVYMTRMLNELKLKNYTFDTISYSKIQIIKKPRNSFGIRAI
jgi:hypothetical protein